MSLGRAVVIFVGGLMLALAFQQALAGTYGPALSTGFLGSGLILLVTWARGSPTAFPARQWIAFAFLAASIAVLGHPILAAGSLLVILLVSLLSGLWMTRGLRSIEFEVVGPEEVMPKAETTVVAFEAQQFRRVGGYRGVIPLFRKVTIATVMAGPDADRFAVVTDRVVEVVSRFGGRWLITTNSGLATLPADVLRQLVAQGAPAELADAHQAAVEVLAGRGVRPDRFGADADALEAAVALERHALSFASERPVGKLLRVETRGKSGDPVLGDDERSRRRIEAWLTAQPSV